MANILAEPLIAFAPEVAKLTRPGAHLILSGLLDHQAREVLARYLAAGFTLSGRCLIEGWTALHLQRARHLQKSRPGYAPRRLDLNIQGQ
ncbi:MAG: hypothetical protein HC850_01210 [Rhodomicrobium sp.]|nr:hypothetical protein [Rhodomicrobium sp.]